MNKDNNRSARRITLLLAAAAILLSAAAAGLALQNHALRKKIAQIREDMPLQQTPAPSDGGESEALSAPEPQTDAAVQRALDSFVAAQGGTWDIFYESLETGDGASARSGHEKEPRSVSASVIKLFVMGAVYDAVERGDLRHDDVYGSLTSMITISDNDACNRLVRLLGGGDEKKGIAAVNAFAADLGCKDTQMNRLMLQNNGTENYVTARDCALMLRLIDQGACVSPEASEEMLALLKAQTVNDRLPAALPQGVTVAHKTGNLSNLSCGDVGIVFTDKGDYILCVLSNYSQNDAETTAAIAALSRTVYDIVTA